jgi:hypothetical protein
VIGDPVAALGTAGDDPTALAIRGVALAQLDEGAAARRLLTRARTGYLKLGDALGAARASAALAEIGAVERDVKAAVADLEQAIRALDRAGDVANAAWARLVLARLETLRGGRARALTWLEEAERSAAGLPAVQIYAAIVRAEVALRRMEATAARRWFASARREARRAPPAIVAELDRLEAALVRPVARVGTRTLDAIAVERASRSVIIVDGLRRRLRAGTEVDLSRRPVLFALLHTLARAHPRGVSGDELILAAFDAARPNESHRARLRVELGRLRKLLPAALRLVAGEGWRVETGGASITIIEPLGNAADAALDALLADGAAWSAVELAAILDTSVRTIQRLAAARPEAIATVGKGRARRYVARDASGFATQMLLLGLSLHR